MFGSIRGLTSRLVTREAAQASRRRKSAPSSYCWRRGFTLGSTSRHCVPRSSGTPLTMPADHHRSDATDQVESPEWLLALQNEPGVVDDVKAQYWEDDDQVHGEDTILKFLHSSAHIHGHVGPAVLGARVLVNRQSRTIYGFWPLGRFVCGHKGICHGGMTSLAVDEMAGQAYVHLFQKERGPGFTANLTVNYKAPIPAFTCVLLTVTVESVEGRKIWFATKVTDGPEGTVFAEARTLFIVARKDEEEPSNGEGE